MQKLASGNCSDGFRSCLTRFQRVWEHRKLSIGSWLEAGRLFEDIRESSRAIDSVTLRIAYPFHDIRTFQSVEPAIAGAIIKQ